MPLHGEPFAGPIQKPERRAVTKKLATRQRFVLRRQCREIVYRREQMRCQRCGKRTKHPRECYPGDPDMAHVHEIVARSRGGSALEPENCQLLCGACHLPPDGHRAGDRSA